MSKSTRNENIGFRSSSNYALAGQVGQKLTKEQIAAQTAHDNSFTANHPNRGSNAKTARAYVANMTGVERVRVTKDGVVHAYGTMPNTNQTGWYLAGYVDDLATQARA